MQFLFLQFITKISVIVCKADRFHVFDGEEVLLTGLGRSEVVFR